VIIFAAFHFLFISKKSEIKKKKNMKILKKILFELIVFTVFGQIHCFHIPSFLQNNENSFDKHSDDKIEELAQKEGIIISSLADLRAEIELRHNFSMSVSKCGFTPSPTYNVKSNTNQDPKWKLKLIQVDSHSRLFSISETKFGLITSSAIQIYSFPQIKPNSENISLIETITFKGKIILDACADKSKNVYVLFSVENKIVKYFFDDNNPSKLLRIRSLHEIDFKPAAISCTDELLYVSSRENSEVRVYNHLFKSIDKIHLSNVIVSVENNLAVDSNIKVFTDGFDAVGLFEKDGTTCHFYLNLNCIEDIDVQTEISKTSSIYVVDSCEKNVKQFVHSQDKKILLKRIFNIEKGVPISSFRNGLNSLIVLTKKPSKLFVFNLN
jgi:hypothetical protein